MNNYQIKILSKMKQLIKKGNRKFLNRKDRNYLDDLLEIELDKNNEFVVCLSFHRDKKKKSCYDEMFSLQQ